MGWKSHSRDVISKPRNVTCPFIIYNNGCSGAAADGLKSVPRALRPVVAQTLVVVRFNAGELAAAVSFNPPRGAITPSTRVRTATARYLFIVGL